MFIEILAAGGTAPQNAFGFWEAMEQGGVIAWFVLGVLAIMSVSSFYILFSKLFEQNKVILATLQTSCARITSVEAHRGRVRRELDAVLAEVSALTRGLGLAGT